MVLLVPQIEDPVALCCIYNMQGPPCLDWHCVTCFFLFILGGQNNHDIIIKKWRSFFIFLKFHHSKTIQIKFQRTVGPERKQINCCSWHSFVDISVVVVAVVPDRKCILIKIKMSASHNLYNYRYKHTPTSHFLGWGRDASTIYKHFFGVTPIWYRLTSKNILLNYECSCFDKRDRASARQSDFDVGFQKGDL